MSQTMSNDNSRYWKCPAPPTFPGSLQRTTDPVSFLIRCIQETDFDKCRGFSCSVCEFSALHILLLWLLTLRLLMSCVYIYIYIYGAPIFDVSRSHTTHQSVGLLWTSDQLVAETSAWQHTTLTTHKYPCPRWDSNPRFQEASGRRPLACWNLGFESHQGHGYLSVVSVVCCQAEVSVTSWSLVQRSPTDCGASCVI